MSTLLVPGLSAADSLAYRTALNGDCDIRIDVHTLNLSHQLIGSIRPLHVDGQQNWVQGDGTNVTKSIQLNLWDPSNQLLLDSRSINAGMGGLDRLIQVRTYARGPGQAKWVGAGAFTGVPSKVVRDGPSVSLEAQGKESLYLGEVGAWNIQPGENLVAAVKKCLYMYGERRFRFPSGYKYRVPRRTVVGGMGGKSPWTVAWELAKSVGLQLFYDATGYACLRKYPQTAMWELNEKGDNKNVLTPVQVSTDLTTIRNRVVVYGSTVATPKRKGQPGRPARLVVGSATLPPSHPYSPQSLAINGVPQYRTTYVDLKEFLHNQHDCIKAAQTRLKGLSAEQVEIDTNTLPFWHAEPLDIVRVNPIAGTSFTVRFKTASAPYGPSPDGMTFGFVWPVHTPVKSRIPRKVAA